MLQPVVPPALKEACAHGLLGPGKRIRPIMALASCAAVGGDPEAALPVAAAVEAVHAFSLIHDDLPCMDDDDVRRGRPTVHVVHGEATALLAGDALLALAIGHLAASGQPWAARGAALLAEATWAGLVAGQVLDMAAQQGDRSVDLPEVHALKTGRLIRVSCQLGGLVAGADPDGMDMLGRYGEAVGLAFQIADDLLDDGEDPASLLTVWGREKTEARGLDAVRHAREALSGLGPRAGLLHELATAAFHRSI